MLHVQHCIDTGHRWDADRPWRQSGIAVGVVGAVDREQVVVDALESELLPGELDRRVSLQRHTFGVFGIAKHQPVVVHTSDHRFFAVVGSLLVDDAGQRSHLYGIETEGIGLGHAIIVPEEVVFFLHTLHQSVDRDIPVDIIGVGDEQCSNSGRVVAVLLAEGLVGEVLGQRGTVDHQFFTELSCQILHGSHAGHREA